VEEKNNEVELLVMVTPEFVDALDPHEVPPCGPGQLTTTPCDVDLYLRGYLEVPRCCPDGSCGDCQTGFSGPGSMPVQTVPYENQIVPAEAEVQGASATLRDLQPQSSGRDYTPPQPGLIGPLGYDDLE
jgi:pilus assembly protein CpaC